MVLNWLQTSGRVELVHVGMRQTSQARVPANHRTCIAVVAECRGLHYLMTGKSVYNRRGAVGYDLLKASEDIAKNGKLNIYVYVNIYVLYAMTCRHD